jgi:hypothetical protein
MREVCSLCGAQVESSVCTNSLCRGFGKEGLVRNTNTNWFALAIYLDGIRRYQACRAEAMSVPDVLERLQFVHDNIELCLADGRLIDRAIFDDLEDAADRISRADAPTKEEALELAQRLADRYGFRQKTLKNSTWIKVESDGECMIWIDQLNIIAESNRRLFGSRG